MRQPTRFFLCRSLPGFALWACSSASYGAPGRIDPEKTLTNSSWAKQVRVHYKKDRDNSTAYPVPWNENPPMGRTLPRPKTDSRNLTLVVEWSSAPPVRQARRRLQRELKIPQPNAQYIISIRELPLEVKFAFATLKRSGHPNLPASRIERTTEDDMRVIACYFPTVDPITANDKLVRVLFQSAGIHFVVSFSIAEMFFQGQLALL